MNLRIAATGILVASLLLVYFFVPRPSASGEKVLASGHTSRMIQHLERARAFQDAEADVEAQAEIREALRLAENPKANLLAHEDRLELGDLVFHNLAVRPETADALDLISRTNKILAAGEPYPSDDVSYYCRVQAVGELVRMNILLANPLVYGEKLAPSLKRSVQFYAHAPTWPEHETWYVEFYAYTCGVLSNFDPAGAMDALSEAVARLAQAEMLNPYLRATLDIALASATTQAFGFQQAETIARSVVDTLKSSNVPANATLFPYAFEQLAINYFLTGRLDALERLGEEVSAQMADNLTPDDKRAYQVLVPFLAGYQAALKRDHHQEGIELAVCADLTNVADYNLLYRADTFAELAMLAPEIILFLFEAEAVVEEAVSKGYHPLDCQTTRVRIDSIKCLTVPGACSAAESLSQKSDFQYFPTSGAGLWLRIQRLVHDQIAGDHDAVAKRYAELVAAGVHPVVLDWEMGALR